jgi:hypothetical protein
VRLYKYLISKNFLVKQFKVLIRLDSYELDILRVFLEVEESIQYSSIFLSFLKNKINIL